MNEMLLAQEASGGGGAAILLILSGIAMYFVPLIVGAIRKGPEHRLGSCNQLLPRLDCEGHSLPW
jgi:hypothetical protein